MTEQGKSLGKELCAEFNQFIDQCLKEVGSYVEANRGRISRNTSLGEYLMKKLDEKLENHKELSDEERQQIYGLIAWRFVINLTLSIKSVYFFK